MDLDSPTPFGPYTLLRKLGQGGMAEIHLAVREGLPGIAQLVVIKRIREQKRADPALNAMFMEEARIAATLTHPNIGQIHDVGQVHGQHFLAMEYLHGVDLRTLQKRMGRNGALLPLHHALWIIDQAAAGLHYAHIRTGADGTPMKIVHRDISPHNIFVTFDGGVKLLDFGIAKAEHRLLKTASGVIKGKLPYMSPEQVQGLALEATSDLYALAVVLWELTVGRRLYVGLSDYELLRRIAMEPVPAPSSVVPDYAPGLERIVLRALANDPRQRYPSVRDFRVALQTYRRERDQVSSDMELGALMRELFPERLDEQRQSWDLGSALLETHGGEGDATGATRAAVPSSKHVPAPHPAPGAAVPAPAAGRKRPWLPMVGLGVGLLAVAGVVTAAALGGFGTASGTDDEPFGGRGRLVAAAEQTDPGASEEPTTALEPDAGREPEPADADAATVAAEHSASPKTGVALTPGPAPPAARTPRPAKIWSTPKESATPPATATPAPAATATPMYKVETLEEIYAAGRVLKKVVLDKHRKALAKCLAIDPKTVVVHIGFYFEAPGLSAGPLAGLENVWITPSVGDVYNRDRVMRCIEPLFEGATLPRPADAVRRADFDVFPHEVGLSLPSWELNPIFASRVRERLLAAHPRLFGSCAEKHPGTRVVDLEVVVDINGRVLDVSKVFTEGAGADGAYACLEKKLLAMRLATTPEGGRFMLSFER